MNLAFSMNLLIYSSGSIKTMFSALQSFHKIFLQFLAIPWICCSITAAASKWCSFHCSNFMRIFFNFSWFIYNDSSITKMFSALQRFHYIFLQFLVIQWICCSITAAASKRPMPLKIFVKLDTAKISLFLASHKCRMASVGLGLVAKKVT